MKNLLIYVNPQKDFDEESKILAKVQIDNTLDLGWKKEDILLVTNFPYEYNGVRALVVGDDAMCSFSLNASKLTTIVLLFNQGLIQKGEMYWCHDFDCYQMNPMIESDLKLEPANIGLTDYGRMLRWHMSSIFFKYGARDVFSFLKEVIYKSEIFNEEDALLELTDNNTNNIGNRIKKLNITYNFSCHNVNSCYLLAEKPIKNVHFHLTRDMLDFFMYGKNKINKVLLEERIIKIFKYHGIT